MKKENNHQICPAEHANHFDGFFRKLIQSPKKITGRHVNQGDTVIDIGCGPGFFTREMALTVGNTGKVIAVDVQDEMLSILKEKAEKEGFISNITIHKADPDSINLPDSVRADFVLAFYVIHEMSDFNSVFREIFGSLKPGGKMLVAEPSMIISKEEFDDTLNAAERAGFKIIGRPKIWFSKSVLLLKPE